MQVYSNVDLTGANIPPRQVTIGSKTVGLVITNYSNVGFNLNTDSNANLGTLPPYFSMNVSVNPGDVIYFNETSIATTALPQPSMFVTLAESQQPVSAGITPLAIVPGYQLNTTGTVSFAPGQEVAIQGTPEVNLASGTQVEINNAQIPANVVNANLNVNPGIKSLTITLPITNLAPGATVYYQGAFLSIIALVDELWLFVNSSQQITNDYSDFLLVELYRDDINYSIKPINQTGDVQSVNSYEQTVKFTNLDFPCDSLRLGITNTSASTIVSDTLTLNFYAKYASQSVSNPALNSLQKTEFDVTANGATTILTAGGHIYRIVFQLNVFNPSQPYSSGDINLTNGGNKFFQGRPKQTGFYNGSGTSYSDNTAQYQLDFSSGIDNNGIVLNLSGYVEATGYILHD